MENIVKLEFHKFCTRCKTDKFTSDFSKCKTYKDGLSMYCRSCNKELKDKRKPQNKEYHAKRYNAYSDKEILLKNIRSNAAKRGESTDITLDDIPPVPSFCPILGIPITTRSRNRSNAVSVDRIDNSKGYVKGNIVLISMKANVCKNNMTFDQIASLYNFYKQFQPE